MLQEKVALVTGSTSGIGRGVAEALAEAGCHVMLHGLADAEVMEERRLALEQRHGIAAGFHDADLTDPLQVEDLVRATIERLGGLDILVNNAGIQHTAAVEEFPVAKWNEILAVNVSAAFHTIRLALPGMRSKGWGRILNTASVHGLVASKHKAAYVAAKHALVGLTRVVALETAGSGITCNAICPGWTRTELIEPQIALRAESFGGDEQAGARDLLAEKQPSLEFVRVEQLGQLAVFLCSPAADQITGVALPVDGGWTAQ